MSHMLSSGAQAVSVRDRSRVLAQALWIVGFAAATAAAARFEIAHQPVPYTLQTLVVLLAGAFLGARNGAVSQLLYLGAGALGAPVFSSGSIGMAKLLGPTGGYLLAFPLAAFLVGLLLERRRTLPWCVGGMASGLALIFLSGATYLGAVYLNDLGAGFASGFLLFTWWDLLKLGAASMIYFELSKRWPRLPA